MQTARVYDFVKGGHSSGVSMTQLVSGCAGEPSWLGNETSGNEGERDSAD
ncbi:MAG TPA: hypothetical protein VME18_13885 [Acidobacteriaceae bacterium]|nr:hypothetical protein [Acidobacteriaceae bacterium]